jgi:mRNA-degrading endonuclease toxin of MazEF toxin-antitoxin module
MPPKPVYKRGNEILVLSPYADLRTTKHRPALIVQANDLRTGFHQVIVATLTTRLFRANHPRWAVEVVTGEALVMFADAHTLASAKATFPFFWVGVDGSEYSLMGIHRDDHPVLLLRSAHRTGNDRSEKLDTRLVG